MKSEILIEIEENMIEIKKLIGNQKFRVGDAWKYLERYGNYAMKIEELTKSRDLWRKKYEEVRKTSDIQIGNLNEELKKKK